MPKDGKRVLGGARLREAGSTRGEGTFIGPKGKKAQEEMRTPPCSFPFWDSSVACHWLVTRGKGAAGLGRGGKEGPLNGLGDMGQ